MMPQQGADHLCSEGRDRNRLVVSVHVEHCLVVAVCANDLQRAEDSVDVSPVKAVLLRPGCLASGSLDFEPKQLNDVLLPKNAHRWVSLDGTQQIKGRQPGGLAAQGRSRKSGQRGLLRNRAP